MAEKDYTYMPPMGPLPGKSFEKQTTQFFNELQSGQDTNADAITVTQDAIAAVQSFVSEATAELQEELGIVEDKANTASSKATQALEDSASALALAQTSVQTTGNQTVAGEKKFTSVIVGSITGNSGTSSKLQTARNISLSGDVTGSASFDGSNNVTIATSISGGGGDESGVPVGTIIWSANATVPAGYLLCNGSAVGRATYPELFAAIGTAFGSGDGSTTFNLPNLIDKFIQGSTTAGTVKAAGLPNITGEFNSQGDTQEWRWPYLTNFTGAFANTGDRYTGVYFNGTVGGATGKGWGATFDASASNAIYGNSNTVQPPAVTALPCIKAFSSVVGDATVVAGQLVNEIQSKVSLDGSNLSGATVKAIVETWHSGTEWYRVWSDGWIEQGGHLSPASVTTEAANGTLNKAFSNTNYYIKLSTVSNLNLGGTAANEGVFRLTGVINTKSISSFSFHAETSAYVSSGYDWYACGY